MGELIGNGLLADFDDLHGGLSLLQLIDGKNDVRTGSARPMPIFFVFDALKASPPDDAEPLLA
jgi:hypothetical protein